MLFRSPSVRAVVDAAGNVGVTGTRANNCDVLPVAPLGSGFAALADMIISDNGGVAPIPPINAGGVTDALGRTISYTATGLPVSQVGVGVGALVINSATGVISGTYDAILAASFVVTVTASNGARSITKTFTLTILDDG